MDGFSTEETIIVLAATNRPEMLDKALLRKVRCYVNYEFKKLCAEKTKAILNERGIVLDNYEPMTLAEIYNYDKTDCTIKKETKIGF